jgi:hypothetical protein
MNPNAGPDQRIADLKRWYLNPRKKPFTRLDNFSVEEVPDSVAVMRGAAQLVEDKERLAVAAPSLLVVPLGVLQ